MYACRSISPSVFVMALVSTHRPFATMRKTPRLRRGDTLKRIRESPRLAPAPPRFGEVTDGREGHGARQHREAAVHKTENEDAGRLGVGVHQKRPDRGPQSHNESDSYW